MKLGLKCRTVKHSKIRANISVTEKIGHTIQVNAITTQTLVKNVKSTIM